MSPAVAVFLLLGVLHMVASAPSTPKGDDCSDRKDCSNLDIRTSCCGQYEAYSRWNCAKYCRFCTPKVTPAPHCKDNIPNCNEFQSDLCSNPGFVGFVKNNCAGYCKLCDKPPYIPDCARKSTVSAATTTTTTTQSTTTTRPLDKCEMQGYLYSQGEEWFSAGCRQRCSCIDSITNQIECGPLNCPKWIHNCDLVPIQGSCCPILKCNYFETVHGRFDK